MWKLIAVSVYFSDDDYRIGRESPTDCQTKAIDTPAVAAWRERKGSDEAKAIYKKRAATAERVHAQSRNRNLRQFRIRGLAKVQCGMRFFALAACRTFAE